VALLPRADEIAFSRLGETEAEHRFWRSPWDEAVAMVGEGMRPQGLRPERWRVEPGTFPTAEKLAP
jgi:hypothetical protein